MFWISFFLQFLLFEDGTESIHAYGYLGLLFGRLGSYPEAWKEYHGLLNWGYEGIVDRRTEGFSIAMGMALHLLAFSTLKLRYYNSLFYSNNTPSSQPKEIYNPSSHRESSSASQYVSTTQNPLTSMFYQNI